MAESSFAYVTYIRTTPEKLWRALTDPAFTRQYWCETWQDCAWTKGASWKVMAPDGRVADSGEVVEIDPPRKLVLTWQHHLTPAVMAEGHSRMTYTLEPQGDMVKLSLLHEIDVPNSKLIEGVSGGWPMILASLKSLLETGESLEASRKWPSGM
jgi:uncharacterized protein YndB with AHSA1/START domain